MRRAVGVGSNRRQGRCAWGKVRHAEAGGQSSCCGDQRWWITETDLVEVRTMALEARNTESGRFPCDYNTERKCSQADKALKREWRRAGAVTQSAST